MKTRNVLVFPAGTEIGLEIYEALRLCKEVILFGAGVASSSHGPFAFKHFYELPSVNDGNWLDPLINICNNQKIDYIFPAHDDVIVALTKIRNQIPAVILAAEVDVCITTRSKRATYIALAKFIRVPKLYDVIPVPEDFPLFVKPDCGQGSQGVALVKNISELSIAKQKIKDPIICEYLSGEEYTVDCFSDRISGVIFAGARIRKRMRNGISVNTAPVYLEEALDLAIKIHTTLGMRGAWFFQLKRNNTGNLTLLEVAPRIAGSMSAHRVQGMNFPLLTIFEHERLPIRPLINSAPIELDRALRNRYRHFFSYSTLYIDLDDTIILRDKVNLDAIQLIYQSLNGKKKVNLITRHVGNLHETLNNYHLIGIFDEIIHILDGSLKSKYINDVNAIFVDDSFVERWDVSEVLGIPTFDCSMIELLIQSV